jgi:hypothetical protein
MAFKNLQEGNNRRKKIVERFKNRVPLPNMQDKKQMDARIIDSALHALYNDGDKVTRSLQDDILKPANIKISEKEVARIWDIMINMGLVHAVIGFGNSGKLDLTNEGYQLMSQFGSYSAFLDEKSKQTQSQNMVFPQFIIEQAGNDQEEEGKEENGEKAVGKKKDQ